MKHKLSSYGMDSVVLKLVRRSGRWLTQKANLTRSKGRS